MDQEIIKKVNEALRVFHFKDYEVCSIYNDGSSDLSYCHWGVTHTDLGETNLICCHDKLSKTLWDLIDHLEIMHGAYYEDFGMLKVILRGYAVLAEDNDA